MFGWLIKLVKVRLLDFNTKLHILHSIGLLFIYNIYSNKRQENLNYTPYFIS
jgi:hypothetical protein